MMSVFFIQELMNNEELVGRVSGALIKGDMYERVSAKLIPNNLLNIVKKHN